ncbi:D-glutamate cyclase, mitochondrial-like isoform X2 [Rhopilema esculentum]|uniref:D-glutamate cyclase, mitochondrial-like isoform X2 n=1 Tax=Rhopilema esculentum TaxID=499914 RepID=UPI0031E3DA02
MLHHSRSKKSDPRTNRKEKHHRDHFFEKQPYSSVKQARDLFWCYPFNVRLHHSDSSYVSNLKGMGSESFENETPEHMRLLFRENKLGKCTTAGMCGEHLQSNVAIIPSEYAADFRKFVDLNSGPCSLLYESKVGEVGAPLLAKGSDIRTDLPAYNVFVNGKACEDVESLANYNWDDMVTFYFGCIFAFEKKYHSADNPIPNIEGGKNVSMHATNIPCFEAGPFGCNLLVSMKPLPENLIDKAVSETLQLDFTHGAPVHIGNPAEIGIEDLNSSSIAFHDEVADKPLTLREGDVPVFWACGVTSGHALEAARIPITFSHSPGCMFITDRTNEDARALLNAKTYPEARTVCLDKTRKIFSLVSCQTWDKITKLESLIIDDPGNRGVQFLQEKTDLHSAALSISQSAKSVAILTGFSCLPELTPSIENDGISGAVAIAKAVQALGKPVTLIVGKTEKQIFKDILMWCHANGILKHEVSVVTVENAAEMLYDELMDQKRFSHLISIERPGRNSNGQYCTMNKKDISGSVDAVDELFLEAKKHPEIVTIGIGDGGNEIGMGKVLERVAANVKHGSEIGCTVSCDYLITAGVSNWGGYALAKAIYMCVSCPVHDRYRRKSLGLPSEPILDDFVTTVEQEEKLLEHLVSLNIRDGITKEASMSVDGIDFVPYHANKIADIAAV